MTFSFPIMANSYAMELHERLTAARIHAKYASAADAARALGVPYPTYAGHENGSSGFRARSGEKYARRFKVRFEWLMNERGPMIDDSPKMTTIVGKAGAATDGVVVFAEGHGGFGTVMLPEGASANSVAIEVEGYSMGLLADGALVFYSDRLAPSDDMIGTIVIVETDNGEVLLKRLLRGSRQGLFDLESLNGPTLRDRRLRWAAHIDSLVPPWRAKRMRIEAADVGL